MHNNAKLKESKSNDRRRTQLFSSRRRHRQLCTHTRTPQRNAMLRRRT